MHLPLTVIAALGPSDSSASTPVGVPVPRIDHGGLGVGCCRSAARGFLAPGALRASGSRTLGRFPLRTLEPHRVAHQPSGISPPGLQPRNHRWREASSGAASWRGVAPSRGPALDEPGPDFRAEWPPAGVVARPDWPIIDRSPSLPKRHQRPMDSINASMVALSLLRMKTALPSRSECVSIFTDVSW